MQLFANRQKYHSRMCYRAILMLGIIGVMMLTGGCGRDSGKTETTVEQTGELMERCVVRVQSGSLLGSGIVYRKEDDLLVIVTAAHVLEQNREHNQTQNPVLVTFYDDFTMECSSYYVSESSDVAFIQVPLAGMPADNSPNYIPVSVDKEAFDQLQGGAEVFFQSAVGAEDMSEQGTVLDTWIYVEDFQQYMMLLQGEITPGMSGGGVFDQNMNLIGVLCGVGEQGEVAAVPLSIIQAEFAGIY